MAKELYRADRKYISFDIIQNEFIFQEKRLIVITFLNIIPLMFHLAQINLYYQITVPLFGLAMS